MKYWLISVTVILGFVCFYQFSTPNLIGNDDVYWHIQYSSQMLSNLGEFKDFLTHPIPYTGFLFHVFLSVFTVFLPLAIASKAAGIFLIAVIFISIGKLLQELKVRGVWLWLLLLFVGSLNFSFRIMLTRTFLMSIIFLVWGIYFLHKKSRFGLGLTGLLYGLSYVAAPALVLIAGLWSLVDWIASKKRDFNLFYISAVSVLFGFILNPAFPDSIGHVFRYVVPVFTSVSLSELSVGIEMYSYPLFTFISNEFLILIAWLPTLYLSYKQLRSKSFSTESVVLQAIALMAFAMALFARRFIEYWAPFAVITSAVIYSSYLWKAKSEDFKMLLAKDWHFKLALAVVISAVSILSWNNLGSLKDWTKPAEDIEHFRNSGEWLQNNAQAGETVFNATWYDYPKMYFWNPKNNYFVKFDPSSLYIDDPKMYWKWRNLSDDNLDDFSSKDLYITIALQADSKYVYVNHNNNPELLNRLSESTYFEQVYTDDATSIFQATAR